MPSDDGADPQTREGLASIWSMARRRLRRDLSGCSGRAGLPVAGRAARPAIDMMLQHIHPTIRAIAAISHAIGACATPLAPIVWVMDLVTALLPKAGGDRPAAQTRSR